MTDVSMRGSFPACAGAVTYLYSTCKGSSPCSKVAIVIERGMDTYSQRSGESWPSNCLSAAAKQNVAALGDQQELASEENI